jgi:hypothetical protein
VCAPALLHNATMRIAASMIMHMQAAVNDCRDEEE